MDQPPYRGSMLEEGPHGLNVILFEWSNLLEKLFDLIFQRLFRMVRKSGVKMQLATEFIWESGRSKMKYKIPKLLIKHLGILTRSGPKVARRSGVELERWRMAGIVRKALLRSDDSSLWSALSVFILPLPRPYMVMKSITNIYEHESAK